VKIGLTIKNLKRFLKRPDNTHKGDYGRLLVVAGSRGMSGAAYLASMAALRSGTGLVYLAIPKGINTILEKRAIEVITEPLSETAQGTLSVSALKSIKALLKTRTIDAVCLGPGLSTHPSTRRLIRSLLPFITCPLLIDADGLNCLVGAVGILKKHKGIKVITPHPGELSRLTGIPTRKINQDRVKTTLQFAQSTQTVVLLKGHHTVVADPSGKHYVNRTGNAGMATAGSGDVLSGILSAFLAKGASPFESACWAAYVHGLAGDRAARKKEKTSLIARDLLEHLPSAFKSL
jgi:ADP-dependent NAD(P)H-hydrate dehydratase / NAD(P)H-hydrate epimerase